jgi:TonB family protein
MVRRFCAILFFVLALSLFCVAAGPQDAGPSDAVRSMQLAAEQGNVTAQFDLGMAYRYGLGIQQNSVEAAKWFRISAEKGNARAQFELGKMYEEGIGVTKDYAEAMKWYRKAAEQSLAQMLNSVTTLRGGGIGTGINRGSGGGIGSGRGPYVVGNGVKPPVPLTQPMPAYTEEARRARISGIVVIQCVVRADGTVDSFRVLRGLGYGLDESAINTLATKWRFKPGTKDDVPVDVMANIEIAFRLPD